MVLLKVNASTQHFRSFYQENSLLIQLVLKELSDIFTLTSPLRSLLQMDFLDDDAWFDHLDNFLKSLVGEHDEGAFTSCEKGPLARLKSYCQHFQIVDVLQDRPLINFSFQVSQVYLHVKQVWHLMHSFETCVNQRKKHAFLVKIQKNAHVMLLMLENILKLFLSCLKKFSDNENVLFFLLRKKTLLIKIYGLTLIQQLFSTFSKKGCLSTLLIKRFKSRGFDHLLPIIKRELFFYESNHITGC